MSTGGYDFAVNILIIGITASKFEVAISYLGTYVVK